LFDLKMTESRRINRYSRVIISTVEKPYKTLFDRIADWVQKWLATAELTVLTVLGLKNIRMTQFLSDHFKDFVWRTLFAKTLPAGDIELVASAHMKVCSVPWTTMHMVGLNSLNVSMSPIYPLLNTEEVDIFITQTPYPARINKNTTMIVRYHDAIPVFMPHTIGDKSLHQATHFYALMSNVKHGAYFACVSDATRTALLNLFPDAEQRAVTIHNMASHHYYPEDSSPKLVPSIIRSRLNQQAAEAIPKFLTLREQEHFYRRYLWQESLNYLVVVSTVEPRKNHARVLAAWERIKAEVDPTLKLVVVGALGWDYDLIMKGFRAWIDRGEAFFLNNVPSPDLRVLYRHAAATICPSLGEGFDFSGIEAMRSGGVALASDIPVHREVYDDAAEYFDPYSTVSLVKTLEGVLYAPDAQSVRERLRARGEEVSSRYLPEKILPKWDAFLKRVLTEKKR
jgi:glycosyltransferase involved in cell wall biosynthesis